MNSMIELLPATPEPNVQCGFWSVGCACSKRKKNRKNKKNKQENIFESKREYLKSKREYLKNVVYWYLRLKLNKIVIEKYAVKNKHIFYSAFNRISTKISLRTVFAEVNYATVFAYLTTSTGLASRPDATMFTY